ncbi:MAG TPA: SPASM domain-containing protein [Patescibacteria group bacterium]|jgi:radical SAM protein with 4Fe4S-binding SPASM domain|nr:SPASM domain-containing protein [Patescibacteria group bacterium]
MPVPLSERAAELGYDREVVKKELVLMIEPTNICNFRCEACYNGATIAEPQKRSWGLDDYRNMLDRVESQGGKIELVDVLGGDMSTRPFEVLTGFLDENRRRNIKTLLVSNLLRFTPQQAEVLVTKVDKLKGKWNVGQDQYELQGELIGRNANTAARMQDQIRMFSETIARTGSNVNFLLDNALRPSNYALVGEYLSFCKSVGATPYIEQLMQVGVDKDYIMTPAQTLEATNIMADWYRQNEGRELLEEMVAPHFIYPCIYLGRSLYVRLNGDVATCPCTEHTFGNIHSDKLDDILNDDVFIARRLLAQSSTSAIISDNGICSTCPDERWQKCHGGCRGTTETVFGIPEGLFKSYPDCPWEYIKSSK